MRGKIGIAGGLMLMCVVGMVGSLSSCQRGCVQEGEPPETRFPSEEFEQARGDRWYGGVFRVAEADLPQNLFPHSIQDVTSWRIASQIFEGLMRLDPLSLKPVPGLAYRYEVEENGRVFRFYLRPGVSFHPSRIFQETSGNSTRTVTAWDVVYSLSLLCTSHAGNHLYASFGRDIIEGCREYYEEGADRLSGVTALSDSVVEIRVVSHAGMFLEMMASPAGFIFPREAIVEETLPDGRSIYRMREYIGTGPFRLQTLDTNTIILVRNEHYYRKDEYGNTLPFLAGIEIIRVPDASQRLALFLSGKLEMVYALETEDIISVLERHLVITDPSPDTLEYEAQRTAEFSTQMLLLNIHQEPLDNPTFRQALSWLIPRQAIYDHVLEGAADKPGIFGVVPPAFVEYPFNDVQGYRYDPEKGQELLRRSGVSLPVTLTLTINRGNPVYRAMAEVIRDTLARYQIQIEIEEVDFYELLEMLQKGDFELARIGWNADFPHPLNFLTMFYGKVVPEDPEAPSYPNFVRYVNPHFDELYEKAANEPNRSQAYLYIVQAENILLKDAPMIVLWYAENYRILQPYVRNFQKNAMELRDWTETYLDGNLYSRVQDLYSRMGAHSEEGPAS